MSNHLYPEDAFRSWEEMRQLHEGTLAVAVSEIVATELPAHPFLLDVACGEGYGKYLLETAGSDAAVISTDYDPSALSSDRWLPTDEEAPRVVADAEKLPFKQGVFDGILSISGIHTLDMEIEPYLKEISRVLKPGGKLILTNDTPRGVESIMHDPYLMEAIRPRDYETVVMTYDTNGEICQPVLVSVDAMNAELANVCSKLGITNLQIENYTLLMDLYELSLVDLYASAAQTVLEQGNGKRPFKDNSFGGSWNRLFFKDILERIQPTKSDLSVLKSIKYNRTISLDRAEPVAIDDLKGIYVSEIQRDSVGNVYSKGLTTDSEVNTQLSVCIGGFILSKS